MEEQQEALKQRVGVGAQGSKVNDVGANKVCYVQQCVYSGGARYVSIISIDSEAPFEKIYYLSPKVRHTSRNARVFLLIIKTSRHNNSCIINFHNHITQIQTAC